jgi:hypothetical protein
VGIREIRGQTRVTYSSKQKRCWSLRRRSLSFAATGEAIIVSNREFSTISVSPVGVIRTVNTTPYSPGITSESPARIDDA